MWYVVGPGGVIICTCETEEEALEIVDKDGNEDLEYYPEEARIRK